MQANSIPVTVAATSVDRWALRSALTLALAAAAGVGVLYGQTLALLPLLVIAWRISPSRLIYIAGYQAFIFTTFPDIALGLANHRHLDGPLGVLLAINAVAVWAFIFALPGLALFGWRNEARLGRRTLAAVTAWIVVPTLISPLIVLHPVLAAGAWFPGTGFYGLALMLLLFCAFAMVNSWAQCAALAIVSACLALVLGDKRELTAPEDITGLRVDLGAPGLNSADRIIYLERLKDSTDMALKAGYKVVIGPEMAVFDQDGTLNAWQSESRRLANRYGAEIWTGASITVDGDLFNMAGSTDANHDIVTALIPLPFVLWKPWQGLPASWSHDRRWRQLADGRRLGFLFCYEALTPATWVERMNDSAHDKTLAFVSNQWWAASPRAGITLDVAARAFARLTDARYVTAVATP